MIGPQEAEDRLVVVGCSWGGLDAVSRVLEGIPPTAACAVVVAPHRGPSPSLLVELWRAHSKWPVVEPDDKEPLRPRHVYVAPAGYHLMVEGSHLALSTEGPHNHSRPSIDVLFESAAKSWGNRVVAVVLTGSNADGAVGATLVFSHGGTVVVQDPEEAVRSEMPRAALAAVRGATVLPLEDIGPRLGRLCPSGEEESRR